ncbi:dihydroorotate dehydrogenase [Veillonella sp. CHU732]|uniref:dihydroorotate dehydrogenase n=1 Tax=Veillonella sp. CHU732 TaxID=2490949 RepID=UPI000F8C431F|nr:dihydroorotate dehydrogenase [Veillonella sp. CHU732]
MATVDPKLAVEFCGISMKNPIVAASGTFGFGLEYDGYLDLNTEVGAISVKGLTPTARPGNAGVRIAETPSGVLNCIGLENPGAEAFVADILPNLKQYDVPIFANISGNTLEEYEYMAKTLTVEGVAALEVNISCPNVKCGGMAFGVQAESAAAVCKAVKGHTDLPVIMKLSPNVTDIVEIARAVEAAGADGISMINTLLGMSVDLRTRKPLLGNIYGGLSGPAVKPVALRLTHQVAQAIEIPIMGGGGIMTGEDALEFMLVGADIVSVGTATMVDPRAIGIIASEMSAYCESQHIEHVSNLVGGIIMP